MPFTVTNVGGRPVRARVQPVAQEPVKAAWLALSSSAERDIPPGGTQQFTVSVKIPPGISAGSYSFRLDAVDVANPDENYTQGPAVSIIIALAPPPPKPFPWWILAVVAVVLIGGGLTIWKMAGTSPTPSPEPTPPHAKEEPSPPPPPPLAPPSGIVSIMNKNTGLCLSPAGGRDDNNAEIVQYLCDGDPSRMWSFQIVAKDIVKIRNDHSKRCLTVAGGNRERDDPSVQYNCDEDRSRRWQFVPVDATTFRLKNDNSGLCLTIPGGAKDLNKTAVQNECENDPSTEWTVK
jgi:hypothetical protein